MKNHMIKPKVRRILNEIMGLNFEERTQLLLLYLLPPIGIVTVYLIYKLFNLSKSDEKEEIQKSKVKRLEDFF